MAEFNYVLHKNNEQDGYTIVKTFESPTFKRFELDPTEAYEKVTINNKRNFPGLFDIEKSEIPEFCGPMRKVMCRIDECDFCQIRKTDKDIHQEYTDMENHMGYFYCDECKDLLMEGLKNTGIRPIWYIRERFQKQGDHRCLVWVERTRRDEDGKRVNYGPRLFEKWQIMGWYAYMMNDKVDDLKKPHITCEGSGYFKSVSIDEINRLNPEDNTDYNPNDDPQYK